ncbi:MAG: prenyltransferase/squalene oxidase repeat-containing protein [Planctomycetaceae bacterium]
MTVDQWRSLDHAVDSGLEFLAAQQRSDGSFETLDPAQPAVTSLCVMAFLSRGQMPGEGPYGERIHRAIDFVLATQQASGLLCEIPSGTEEWKLRGSYNHAIAGLMLGEVYGMTDAARQERVRAAIDRALAFSQREQVERKRSPDDRGGWRYLSPSVAIDSDLSVTSWHLMFYRSAKNAEFAVPEESIDAAVAYVERCFDPGPGSFCYGLRGYGRSSFSRSMAGAGIVSLSLAGRHQSDKARRAGQFVLGHPFNDFNRGGLTREDRYYYGAYYCSQAMFQLGGDYYAEFYPGLLQTLVDNQRPDGSWDREANQDGVLGLAYSTSLAILALTPPYQLLPIYQR